MTDRYKTVWVASYRDEYDDDVAVGVFESEKDALAAECSAEVYIEETHFYPTGDRSLQLVRAWECTLEINRADYSTREPRLTRVKMDLVDDEGTILVDQPVPTEMVRGGQYHCHVTARAKTKEEAIVACKRLAQEAIDTHRRLGRWQSE